MASPGWGGSLSVLVGEVGGSLLVFVVSSYAVTSSVVRRISRCRLLLLLNFASATTSSKYIKEALLDTSESVEERVGCQRRNEDEAASLTWECGIGRLLDTRLEERFCWLVLTGVRRSLSPLFPSLGDSLVVVPVVRLCWADSCAGLEENGRASWSVS